MQVNAVIKGASIAGLEKDEWLRRLDDIGEDRGYFQPLGKSHSAILTDEGPVLIVTFESADKIRDARDTALPMGFEIADGTGWSNLCILAHEDSWFRDPSVYGYFDRLVDDGFFEDFDTVVFYGAGMCGYAAAAFSVAAPGATVIALQPQATLEPDLTYWDQRFRTMRRTCFTDRYGFAPDMIEAANRVFVVYDPAQRDDAMHAALFNRAHVARLTCRHLGARLESALISMGILNAFIECAGNGNANPAEFYKLYRARRSYPPYLRNLIGYLKRRDHMRLETIVCQHAMRLGARHPFKRRLREINLLLAEVEEPEPAG